MDTRDVPRTAGRLRSAAKSGRYSGGTKWPSACRRFDSARRMNIGDFRMRRCIEGWDPRGRGGFLAGIGSRPVTAGIAAAERMNYDSNFIRLEMKINGRLYKGLNNTPLR